MKWKLSDATSMKFLKLAVFLFRFGSLFFIIFIFFKILENYEHCDEYFDHEWMNFNNKLVDWVYVACLLISILQWNCKSKLVAVHFWRTAIFHIVYYFHTRDVDVGNLATDYDSDSLIMPNSLCFKNTVEIEHCAFAELLVLN